LDFKDKVKEGCKTAQKELHDFHSSRNIFSLIQSQYSKKYRTCRMHGGEMRNIYKIFVCKV